MKKQLTFLLSLLLMLSLCAGAFAEGYEGTVTPNSVLLMNADTGEVLYEKNAQTRVYPASTTKLMTALVVSECCTELSALVTVYEGDLNGIVYKSDSTLDPMLCAGEEMSVHELLYGLLLASGNDAAAVLARFVGGTTAEFVELMNKKAAELGMVNTHYSNPHGIQDENHFTTASDMALLAREILKNPTLMEIVGASSYTIPASNMSEARTVESTNRLLCDSTEKPEQNGHIYAYATGMKTGSTPSAHGCLVASAERNGVKLLCLIYGDESENEVDRFSVAAELFDYGFAAQTEGDTAPADEHEEGDTAPAAPAAEKTGHPFLKAVCIILAVIFLLIFLFAVLLLAKNTADEKKRQQLVRRRRAKGEFPYRMKDGETEDDALRREKKRIMRYKSFIKQWRAIAIAAFAVFVLFAVLAFICRGKAETDTRSDAGETTQQDSLPAAFTAAPTDKTTPEAMRIKWEIFGSAGALTEYERAEPISLGEPSQYFALNGVCTFRGNNFRSDPSFGTAKLGSGSFSDFIWDITTDTLMTSGGGSVWTGSGWTGQPLIVQWDDETRSHMNIYDSKRNKEGLTEVIYATLDGHIYFLDIDDGQYTRDPLNLGMCFKGSGALDPRGYPLMYVGSGDATIDGERPKMYVINLIDCRVLYTYGDNDPEALRRDNDTWTAFDSSPLVDAETDTLIWPGENGILYTIKLNSSYDKSAGSISVSPTIEAKARYSTARSGEDSYWYGFECSADVIDHYIYLSENGGMFYCVDLNTMQLVWAQDTKDDSNSSPAVEYDKDSGKYYIYTAPSLHWTKDADSFGSISIYKLDAQSGETVWSNEYSCYSVEGVSGGVQASPLLGREGTDLEGTIIYPVARTPSVWSGVLVALDTETGAERWRFNMDAYAWSSPVAVYGDDGRAYVVIFDSAGKGFLLDGRTGELLDTVDVGYLVEASPVVYNDMVIIGTRGQKVYCMKVS